jgi:hypothetical protein
MADGHQRFPAVIQKLALARQKFRCGSCETLITDVGEAGISTHAFGERAEGHHIIPHKMGGPISLENCVVLCRSCHIGAHQGGRWQDISIYDDLKRLDMTDKIAKVAALYPHYRG